MIADFEIGLFVFFISFLFGHVNAAGEALVILFLKRFFLLLAHHDVHDFVDDQRRDQG